MIPEPQTLQESENGDNDDEDDDLVNDSDPMTPWKKSQTFPQMPTMIHHWNLKLTLKQKPKMKIPRKKRAGNLTYLLKWKGKIFKIT